MAEDQLKKRKEVDAAYKWHIEDLFETDEAWEQAYKETEAGIKALASYEGKLASGAEVFLSYMKKKEEISIAFESIYVYANQKYHEDTGNAVYQAMSGKAQGLAVMYSSAMSFEEPELIEIGKEKTDQWVKKIPELKIYERMFYELFRQQEHVLSKEMESVLTEIDDLSQETSNTFSMFNNADVKFPSIKDKDGKDIAVTHGRYTSLLKDSDREVRRQAFESMYSQYEQYKNTLASVYQNKLKNTALTARLRKYDSSLAMALDGGEIPTSVYDELIESVHDHMDLMYKYVDIRKKALKLEELHMYDLYAPMVDDVKMHITFEEAKEIVKKALAPLGEEYVKILSEGMDGGWIDVYENEGKRSGAYSWGAYGTHPFVLLNHQNDLNSVFTLAHEMGHSMHSYYSDKSQPYVYAGYRIFVAEVASTCNEALLMEYLLKNTEDKKERAYLINYFLEQFKGTLYRQTMFAEFEKIVHEKTWKKEPLTAKELKDIYYDLNKQYFGEGVVIDEAIAMEWARIPHFYTPFYVYQYATGYSAAIAISRKILSGDQEALEGYFKFLSGGSSKNPIDLLKLVGVDMTTKEPVEEALALFADLLEQMEDEI